MVSERVSRRVFLPGLIALAVVLVVGAYWLARKDFSSLPVYGELPEFSLTDSGGGTFTRKNLFGKVWAVHTIFTRCTVTCPLQTATLQRIQKEFSSREELRFLAISLDPGYDTPAVLAGYARARGIDMARWVFLTGKEKAVADLVHKGFRLAYARTGAASRSPAGLLEWLAGVFIPIFFPTPAYAHRGEHSPPAGGGGIVHSSRFVLVDRKARVRGYYHSDQEESLQKLRRDIRALL